MRHKTTVMSGWGRARSASVEAVRPERMSELLKLFSDEGGNSVCVYGAGRSYGDCALNEGGLACLTERLDRILAFDQETGRIDVEPGVTFAKLVDVFLPRGWLAPVTPGTSFATIGGAVANDVHGKNHEKDGTFGQYVTEIDLLLPDGVLHTITPLSHPEWFRATVGGIGLTGVMTRISFSMKRVTSDAVTVTERPAKNLENFLADFASASSASYSVGWIDGLAKGASLGRGILETAEPSPVNAPASLPRARAVPLDFPGFVLNPLSIAAFNEIYFRRVPTAGRQSVRPYRNFFYPLDAIHNWNRIYGKRGFHQFQCVVPFADGERALRLLLEAISGSRMGSFLAVLKRMGPGRVGHLSFPMAGYTLALDFPNKAGLEDLYRKLVAITLDHGGRIYLAKDGLLDAGSLGAMYPELGDFRRVLDEVDPAHVMQSDMARRLNIRGQA